MHKHLEEACRCYRHIRKKNDDYEIAMWWQLFCYAMEK
jgi:hypothetical protein